MHCLWCHQVIALDIGWSNFLLPKERETLCQVCREKLSLLTDIEKRCKKCSKQSIKGVCSDCEKWESDPHWNDVLRYNCSVFSYNSMMKNMIARWKYRGDYILVKAFETHFQQVYASAFSKITQPTLVPIPLSVNRLLERGFNQAKELALVLKVPYAEPLTRIDGEKQSKKTRKERMTSRNPFQMIGQLTTPVILIDDIYTTGSTIRHAAKKLKEQGCPVVYSFTLIRG